MTRRVVVRKKMVKIDADTSASHPPKILTMEEWKERAKMRRLAIESHPNFVEWEFDVDHDDEGCCYMVEVPVFKK